MIELQNIHKHYKSLKALDNVSLSIEDGAIFGLLGPSGCGKTTTVKTIAGILRPDGGRVSVMGRKVPDFEVMQQTGYMAQAAALYPTLTGRENLEFFGKMYGLKGKLLNQAVERTTQLVNLTEDLDRQVQNYSGGMKQRLSLAVALLPSPKLLLLDEPTVGIDPLLRREIWEELYRLRDSGVTIVITTHVMEEAAMCSQVAMMREGRVLKTGTPEEIVRAAGTSTLEEAFVKLSMDSSGENR